MEVSAHTRFPGTGARIARRRTPRPTLTVEGGMILTSIFWTVVAIATMIAVASPALKALTAVLSLQPYSG